MQKLWRGSTATGPVVLSTAGWLERRATRLPLPSSSPAMPAALHLRPSPPLRRPSCRCGLAPASPPRRAWLPLPRLARSPYSSAWLDGDHGRDFHAVAGLKNREKEEECCEEEEEEEEAVAEGERRSRASRPAAERRQRVRGPAGPPVGNVDLLANPGVGPKNLRKLVDKGFEEECCEEEEEEEVVAEGERRSRASRPAAERRQRVRGPPGPPVGNVDLLAIPGVGPKNLRKLVDKGFEEVSQLKKLYRDKFFGKSSEKMVEFLQSSVGIIHKNHAESITSFIKESVDEELKEESPTDGKTARKKRLTFCVEGNISVGKTTFLQRIAHETIELRDLVEIVPEPISKWQDIGRDHFNILDAFYAEPQRYAYTFQNYVFVTRFMQERESAGGIKPLRLMERSVFSDRMVFVRAVHEANWMSEMELSIYDSWFDPVVSCLPGLIPDGFIYLRASPDTCHKRMMLRKREEEGGVTLDYLRGLHEKHESWLFPFQSGNHGVLSVSHLPMHMDDSLHPDIRDRVFYLEGDHMHSSIRKVPALVLDCEPNIDFNKDIDAKREYAHQVAEFFEFVKRKKEVPSQDTGNTVKSANQQIMLPSKGGLWVPEGGHFPKSALESLDFRKAMSLFSP